MGELSPLLICLLAWARERSPSYAHQLPRKVEELSLVLISHSAQGSGPIFTWAAQQSWPWRCRCRRSNPADFKAGELALPLDYCCKGWTSQAMLENWPWCWRQGRAGKLTSRAQNQGSVWDHPSIHPICVLLSKCGGWSCAEFIFVGWMFFHFGFCFLPSSGMGGL